MNTDATPSKKKILLLLLGLLIALLFAPIPRVYNHPVYCKPCEGSDCAPCPTQGDIYWERSVAHSLYLKLTYDSGGALETLHVE